MTRLPEHEPLPMWVSSMSVFLNHWFADYDEARTFRDAEGGYLLPFGRYFFVTTGAALHELGLDPADPDWEAIGFDWARPADLEAWNRLRLRREIAA